MSGQLPALGIWSSEQPSHPLRLLLCDSFLCFFNSSPTFSQISDTEGKGAYLIPCYRCSILIYLYFSVSVFILYFKRYFPLRSGSLLYVAQSQANATDGCISEMLNLPPHTLLVSVQFGGQLLSAQSEQLFMLRCSIKKINSLYNLYILDSC